MLTFIEFVSKNQLDISSPEKRREVYKNFRKLYLSEYQKNYNKSRKRVEISLSTKDYDFFLKHASEHGYDSKMNRYIVASAKAYLKNEYLVKNPEQTRDFLFLCRNISSNINQIAYKLNSHSVDPKRFDESAIYSQISKLENLVLDYISNPPLLNDKNEVQG